ncbi:MAG: hypothetical protein WD048_01105 [Chitinophagales bacterium]
MTKNNTIVSEISAIQVKLLFLHFKSVRINEDIQRINSIPFSNPKKPEAIIKKGEIAYCLVDIISLFESYNSLVSNIYSYKNISKYIESNLKSRLGKIQKTTAKWKHVRNKIGGHVDIEPIQEFCENYNYKGVFISNNLEADFKGILILQMIESAINSTLNKSKLFENEVVLTEQLDLGRLIGKIKQDWEPCLDMFDDVFKLLYKIGKGDKLKAITNQDIGIIKF